MAQKVTTFKVYVSNLPPSLTNEQVGALFENYGRVVEREVFKGNYAFVHMEDDEAGMAAIRDLDGKDFHGFILAVCESKNTQGPKMPTMKLAVSNLSPLISAKQLRGMFTKFGFVLEAEVRKGEGHVLLEATGDIRSAINEISGCQIDGLTLRVEAVTNYCPPNPSQASPKSAGKRKPSAQTPRENPRFLSSMQPRPPRMVASNMLHRPMPPPFMGGPPIRPPAPMMMRPRQPPVDFTNDYNYEDDQIDEGQEFHDGWNYGPPEPCHPPRPHPPPMRRPPMFPEYHHGPMPPRPFHPNMRPPFPHPPMTRIPRDRYGPGCGPRPLFDQDACFAEDDPGFHVGGGPPRNNRGGNRFDGPQHLMGKRPGPPGTYQGSGPVRTAKVTKFGKILPQESSKPVQKKRGSRGGAQTKAKKMAKNKGSPFLPSLMDPIPGTVKAAGNNQRARVQNPNGKAVRQATATEVSGIPNQLSGGQPLLALHHEQKRLEVLQNQSIVPPVDAGHSQQVIDFTADIEF